VSISGSLADIAIVDLLQFVHMSQRSGTLLLERDTEQAHISFHRGRIASAWSPRSPSVASYLVQHGKLSAEDLELALEQQRTRLPTESLGQALLRENKVSWTELRDAVASKVEQTIFDLVGWQDGSFRLLADEVRVDDEITFAPGDVLPEVEIDTQGILIEAVRLFDERGRGKGEPAGAAPASLRDPGGDKSANAAKAGPRTKGLSRVQYVSKRHQQLAELRARLEGVGDVEAVDVRDAGAPTPFEQQPIVVVDLRPGEHSTAVLRRIRELHPRAPIVGLVASPDDAAAAFADGAVAVAEASYLGACCSNLLRSRTTTDDSSEVTLRSGLGRLRRVLGDLRSGLLSATVSLNLMTIVADSVERAVLFVQQGDALVALGAFGTTRDGKPLAGTTRGLSLRLEAASALAHCISDGHALTLDYDLEQLPEGLKRVVDRPRSGQGVFFPVLGARRAIGLIYADNGRRASSVKDVELMELATAQVGLAFENELLRRQLERLDRVAV
jgi:hypothetical protein